jgi:hypothetical protein
VQNTRFLLFIAGALRLLGVLSVVAGASGIGYGVALLGTSQWGVGMVVLLFSIAGGGVLCLISLAAADLIPLLLSLAEHARRSAEWAEETRRRTEAQKTMSGLKRRLEGLLRQEGQDQESLLRGRFKGET